MSIAGVVTTITTVMQILHVLTKTGLSVYEMVEKLRDAGVENVPTEKELVDLADQVEKYQLPG